jgi:hypothetical protein
MEAEENTAVKAITRQQQVKLQHTEKSLYVLQ